MTVVSRPISYTFPEVVAEDKAVFDWWVNHRSEWFWLGRLLELNTALERREFDRIEKEYM